MIPHLRRFNMTFWVNTCELSGVEDPWSAEIQPDGSEAGRNLGWFDYLSLSSLNNEFAWLSVHLHMGMSFESFWYFLMTFSFCFSISISFLPLFSRIIGYVEKKRGWTDDPSLEQTTLPWWPWWSCGPKCSGTGSLPMRSSCWTVGVPASLDLPLPLGVSIVMGLPQQWMVYNGKSWKNSMKWLI